MTHMRTFTKTIEEFGPDESISLDIEIDYDTLKPEPATQEYPGSPGHCELVDVTIKSVTTMDDTLTGGFSETMRRAAYIWVDNHWDDISEEIGERLADIDEAAEESQYEARRDYERGE